jgi:hypothetical protein
MGTKPDETVCNRPSGLLVETHIRYQNVDLLVSLRDVSHGFLFRVGFQNAIRAVSAKNESQHLQHCGIVIEN